MPFINLTNHYLKMRQIIDIVEAGEWSKYPDVAKMSIHQIETMRKTVIEMELLGFHKKRKIIIKK